MGRCRALVSLVRDDTTFSQQSGRVLWVSESPLAHSGFGRVASAVVARLADADTYELGVLGWEIEPEPELGNQRSIAWFSPGPHSWSRARMNAVIDQFAPDVVITAGPLCLLHSMTQTPNRAFVKWIGYASFEAEPLVRAVGELLRGMDQVAVRSNWCKSVVEELCPTADCRIVAHGVDSAVFRPLPNRRELRDSAGLSDRFVVGCVARNWFRKQIPILIRAFADSAADQPDAFLYLHMDPDDGDWPLLELAARHGIADRTAFTRGLAGVIGIDQPQLNRIYNLFDVMVLPTMGEAFGLPILEAMAAGAPVAATDCSAVTELVAGRGELIEVGAHMTMPWDGAECAVADAHSIVEQLKVLYGDEERRRRHSVQGRRFAKTMTWDRAADAWIALLRNVLGEEWVADDVRPRVRAVSVWPVSAPQNPGRPSGHGRLSRGSRRD